MIYVLFQNAFGDRIKCKNMYISKQTNFKQKIRPNGVRLSQHFAAYPCFC